jgi:hypothetical protein
MLKQPWREIENMSKELGVWKSEDSALVLVDYQPELSQSIRSETEADMLELHVRLLAKAVKAFEQHLGRHAGRK